MKERKNIDRLFQEKFKDFEALPSEETWASIEAKLDEKKKKRVIPFWWKLSGVAAVFLIGFFIAKSIYDGGIKPENPVVNEGNSNKPNSGNGNKNSMEINNNSQNNDAVVNQGNNKTEKENQENAIKNSIPKNSPDAIVNTPNKVKNNIASGDKNRKVIHSSESAVAEKKPSHRSLKNKSNSNQQKGSVAESPFENQQNQVAEKPKSNSDKENQNQTVNEKGVAQTNPNKTNKEVPSTDEKKNINLDDLKGNNNSKIASKEIDNKKANDTASTKSVAKNELEELLNEKESKLKKEKEPKMNRWQLASNVAPVFLGSIASGSPIDSTLSNNSKSYNTNVGFGIGVSYAVNKKFSVRTGLNKVSMSYDTNDISFFTGIQAKTLANVQPTAASAMIHVESNAASADANPEMGLLPFENTFVHKSSGYLRQEMAYLEMPVEMTYNLLDKKFGVKIIGGFSTFFLQDDSIMLISEGHDTLLGEAKNLNDVHFSTNLGLGLKYNFLRSFELNVEPTFKYQLNTYSANAGNFKPYIFGIYSGISYKF